MTENIRFQIIHLGNPYDFVVKDHQTNKTSGTLQGDDKSLMELLKELNDENNKLLKYKYLVKAFEQVHYNHHSGTYGNLEEYLSDYTDGAYSTTKEIIELGKFKEKHEEDYV